MGASIVRLEGGEFRWEDIPGKGRCLVPIQTHVSESDVLGTRRYRNRNGRVLQIARIYPPRFEGYNGPEFFTVLMSSGRNYSDCSFVSAKKLADVINSAGPGNDLEFLEWVP